MPVEMKTSLRGNESRGIAGLSKYVPFALAESLCMGDLYLNKLIKKKKKSSGLLLFLCKKF